MEEQKKERYLTIREMEEMLNLSRDTIKTKHKKDLSFPAPIKFSTKDHRWSEIEVKKWLDKKSAERTSGTNS